jgi:hypothetical protein
MTTSTVSVNQLRQVKPSNFGTCLETLGGFGGTNYEIKPISVVFGLWTEVKSASQAT